MIKKLKKPDKKRMTKEIEDEINTSDMKLFKLKIKKKYPKPEKEFFNE